MRFIPVAALALFTACLPATISNLNTKTNHNANSRPSSSTTVNGPAAPGDRGPTINAHEPDKYSATMVLSIETEGREKPAGIPPLSAKVARNQDDRRVELALPDGSPLIFLDHDKHHYVILPSRKQYAELPDSDDDQLTGLLTPGQLIEDLKELPGVERVGDETIAGRAADKYRYPRGGAVKAFAFVFIDKETGLPLRAERISESAGSTNATHLIAELRDINTIPDASLFQLPPGYNHVAIEKFRHEIDALTSSLMQALRAMKSGASSKGPAAKPQGPPLKP